MKNFVTAAETVQRLSNEHATLRDQAVEKINALIRESKHLPVYVLEHHFTQVDAVRMHLLRKLREEAGWSVHGPDDTVHGRCYVLTHPHAPRSVQVSQQGEIR